MQNNNDKINFYFVLITFSALFFTFGLALFYLLPADSYFYQAFENSLSKDLLNFEYTFSSVAFALSKVLKYYLFALISLFSSYKERYMVGLLAFRGLFIGITSACLMRGAKSGSIYINHGFLSTFIFILLSVMHICILAYACVRATAYSKRLVYPIQPINVIKRKDTYLFLLDYASFAGIAIIIELFIMGNYLLMVS